MSAASENSVSLESPPRSGRMLLETAPTAHAHAHAHAQQQPPPPLEATVPLPAAEAKSEHPRPILKHRQPQEKRPFHPFFASKSRSAPTGLTPSGGRSPNAAHNQERGVLFASEVSHRTISPMWEDDGASADVRPGSAEADWAWLQLGRPRASAVAGLHGLPTGAFVVRQSESQPGCLALTYTVGGILADELIVAPRGRMDGPGVHLNSAPRRPFNGLGALLVACTAKDAPLPCRLRLPASFSLDECNRATGRFPQSNGNASEGQWRPPRGGRRASEDARRVSTLGRPPLQARGPLGPARPAGQARLSAQAMPPHVLPPRHPAEQRAAMQARRRSAPQLVAAFPSGRPNGRPSRTSMAGAGLQPSPTAVSMSSFPPARSSHIDSRALGASWCFLGQGFNAAMVGGG